MDCRVTAQYTRQSRKVYLVPRDNHLIRSQGNRMSISPTRGWCLFQAPPSKGWPCPFHSHSLCFQTQFLKWPLLISNTPKMFILSLRPQLSPILPPFGQVVVTSGGLGPDSPISNVTLGKLLCTSMPQFP